MKNGWMIVGAILGTLLTLLSLVRLADGGIYLVYVATHVGPMDEWIALSLAEITLAAVGAVAMWRSFAKRQPLAFVGFILLQLPVPMLIETMRF